MLQFDNGRTYLVDHSEATGKISPLDYIVQVLGVKELETVVITHPHHDHFRGIQRIIEEILIRQVWLSDIPYVTIGYQTLQHQLEMRPEIRILSPRSGTLVTEGKDRIQVLAPPTNLLRGTHEDINNASIVLKLTITNPQQNTSTSVILGADAEIASWNQILIEHGCNLQADLFKVSHHGSQYGTDPLTLSAIGPRYSVISVGSNPHGHPDPISVHVGSGLPHPSSVLMRFICSQKVTPKFNSVMNSPSYERHPMNWV